MDRFISLDVETASRYERGSLCQISIAEHINGSIKTLYSTLVNPESTFDPFCCRIHGITPDDVKNSPTFNDIWADIQSILTNAQIVAHNAIFDMSVLERALFLADIMPDELFYTCSLMGAHKAFPKLESYKLSSVCNQLGIDFTNHHDAEADAIACGELTLKICDELNANNLEEMAWRCGNELCSTFTNNYDPENKRRSCPPIVVTSQESMGIMPELDLGCIDESYLKDKVIAFTGELYSMVRDEAIQKAVGKGAVFISNSITKKTNLLIIGSQDMTRTKGSAISSKQRKAMENREKGQAIEWIDEGEFLRLLSL